MKTVSKERAPRVPRLVWLLGALVAVTCCAVEQPPLELTSITPSRVFSDRRTPVLLHGSFYAPVEADLSSGRHRVADSFSVAAGMHELAVPMFLQHDLLSAEVPPGLPIGTFDLTVADPLDRAVRLDDALEVLPPDEFAPIVEIITPSNGQHVFQGATFIVQFRVTEFDPALVALVEWTVAGATSDSGSIVPAGPSASVTGDFPVSVPINSEERRIVVEVVARDDAPEPNQGSDRIEVLVDRCSTDIDCVNGSACDGEERCDDGACVPGEAWSCDDDLSCTLDICDEARGGCIHVADDASCDDGLSCNGLERCDENVGCVESDPPCDDGIACTVDYCSEPTVAGEPEECWSTPADDRCQDGVFCNGVEVCDPHVGCLSGSDPCTDPHECSIETCDEDNRSCEIVLDHDRCRDELECTVDRCVPDVGCVHTPGTEGPPGDPTCVDSIDNDCDHLSDGADPDCNA
jgi:hypothetical protein